jgi:5-formyltetrahydrofolate cyclo-ligase
MEKATLRIDYLEKRKAMSSDCINEQSIQIKQRFFESMDLTDVHYVHIFLPILKQKEINTYLILEEIEQRYPYISLVVSRSLPATNEMEHYLYESDKLALNKWGIPEPFANPDTLISEDKLDLVLVPLLVADNQGNRVGYGKGFYDRFLQKCRPDVLKVGLSLFPPIAHISDVNLFDIPLSILLTPDASFMIHRSIKKNVSAS